MIDVYSGGCHCGTFRVALRTSRSAEALPLRRCACSFCRKHGATTVTDTEGRLAIHIADVEEAIRYRFGAHTADFLVCGRCGVYVAAVLSSEAGAVATLNINVLDDPSVFTQAPQVVVYEAESAQQRRRRRAEQWTITTIMVGTLAQ